VAEESGLIDEISNWMVDRVCRDLEVILDRGLPRIRMSINIADHQFRREDFVETITSIIRSHGLEPAAFELELTERIFMENIETAQEKMRKLKEAGFTISIDDFGTGNSSLAHLKRFDIDTLKIDRSFVVDVPADRQSTDIVVAILSMARALNMKVVAEGVEEEHHLELLKDNGCDEYQGFFFSRPVSRSDFRRLFRENHRVDEEE
jgi:EAL domain-containing protein (putative c-di-GMP-specific phosphodiesterase class I)